MTKACLFLLTALNLFASVSDVIDYKQLGDQYPISVSTNTKPYHCRDKFEVQKLADPAYLKRNNINNSGEFVQHLYKTNNIRRIIKRTPEFVTYEAFNGSNKTLVPYFLSIEACQEFLDAVNNKTSLKKWSNLNNATTNSHSWKEISSGEKNNSAKLNQPKEIVNTQKYDKTLLAKQLQKWLVLNFPNHYLRDDWGTQRTLTKGNNECALSYEELTRYLPPEKSKKENIERINDFSFSRREDVFFNIDMSKIGEIIPHGGERIYIHAVHTVDQNKIDDLERELNDLKDKFHQLDLIIHEQIRNNDPVADALERSDDIRSKIFKHKDELENEKEKWMGLGNGIKYAILNVPVNEENSLSPYIHVLRVYRDLCHEKTVSIRDQEGVIQSMSAFRPFPTQEERGYEKMPITGWDISQTDYLFWLLYEKVDKEELVNKLKKKLKETQDKKKFRKLLIVINKLEHMHEGFNNVMGKYNYVNEQLEHFKPLMTVTETLNKGDSIIKECNKIIDAEKYSDCHTKWMQNLGWTGGGYLGEGLIKQIAELEYEALSVLPVYRVIIEFSEETESLKEELQKF